MVQNLKTDFTIFCDENAGQPAKSSSVGIQRDLSDKENVCQQPLQHKRGLAQPVQPLGHVKVVENFSDSSLMEEEECPMVLDTSCSQQWRVPPLSPQHGETVDIFAAPDYFNVSTRVAGTCSNLPSAGYLRLSPAVRGPETAQV